MRTKVGLGFHLMIGIVALAALAGPFDPCVHAAPATTQLDEFGVPLGDVPPPVPPGFASESAYREAERAGKFETVWTCDPEPVPEGVVETRDVEYGEVGGQKLVLDLYHPSNLEKPAPGLILIHGGEGYRKTGCRAFYRYYGMRYAKRGYAAACIYYRYPGTFPFPAPVQDAKCAVRWMRANAGKYNVNPDKIGAMGIGIGGYLSMMLAYTPHVPELEGAGGWAGVSSRVQAVVALYGACDLTKPEVRSADVVKELLGKNYDEDPKLYERASPINHLAKDSPPTLILQGTIDSIVPAAQADELAGRLKELGVPYQYERFEGWPHLMDTAVDVNKRCQWFINKWFGKYLK